MWQYEYSMGWLQSSSCVYNYYKQHNENSWKKKIVFSELISIFFQHETWRKKRPKGRK